MEKLDKVIAGFESHRWRCDCTDCPYNNLCKTIECTEALYVDTLELLESLGKKYRAALEAAATATELAAKYRKVDGDLISRSELLKFPIRRDHYDRENGNPHFINGIETVMEYAEALPAVAAEPVVHAHWICDCEPHHICSNCHHKFSLFDRVPRCPNCGAHMDEEVADG